MTPYGTAVRWPVFVRGVLLCSLVGALINAGVVTAWAQPPDIPHISSEPLTKSGFEHYYSLEYEKALADFQKVQQAHPDDPNAINHVLEAIIFREIYRSGALETAQYAGNSFLDKKKVDVAPDVQQQIKVLLDQSQRAAEAKLKTNPNDTDALYARGVMFGLKATYAALVDKAWFAALRSAIAARHDHERVLELDPNFADAKTTVGVHQYIAGSLPMAVKIAVSIIGLTGSKKRGIQMLYEAAAANGETSADARVALCLFLRREQRWDEALTVARSLIVDHPRNYLFATEEGNILNAMGRGPEAIDVLKKVVDNGKKGKYFDPHIEVPLFALGEALKGQRRYAEAVDIYEQVPGYPRTDADLRQRAHLYAGESADASGQRDRAMKNYQAAINDQPSSQNAELARKLLKNASRKS
jgi:tetratricopeptide (TPR) repeat protein